MSPIRTACTTQEPPEPLQNAPRTPLPPPRYPLHPIRTPCTALPSPHRRPLALHGDPTHFSSTVSTNWCSFRISSSSSWYRDASFMISRYSSWGARGVRGQRWMEGGGEAAGRGGLHPP